MRERLAKGLVDKGILRTEKRNFLLFDMATHPVADATAKKETLRRVEALSCGSSSRLPPRIYQEGESIAYPATRALLLVCSAFAANVLDNALLHLTYEAREATFQKIEDWIEVFGQWPMAPKHGGISGGAGPAIPASFSSADGIGGGAASSARRSRRAGAGVGPRIAEGSVLPDPADALGAGGGGGHPGPLGAGAMIVDPEKIGVATNELVRAMRAEAAAAPEGTFEAVAGVLAVLGRMDSLVSLLGVGVGVGGALGGALGVAAQGPAGDGRTGRGSDLLTIRVSYASYPPDTAMSPASAHPDKQENSKGEQEKGKRRKGARSSRGH